MAEPFDRYQFIEVRFRVPDQDLRIAHTLNPEFANRVIYIPVMKSHDCTVYDTRTQPGHLAWTTSTVVLRCNVAPSTVWLLLALLPDPVV